MPSKPPIHTVYKGDGWVNVREGSSRSLDRHTTKADALAAGRERAKKDKVEHLIHNKNGQIGARNSYGNDPPGRPG